ncbi:MAG TPA: hypothetical protein VK187_02365 [Geobacteraceae bacterium]|nr:hypothetical protein [Geobacteraceae bacterium]
MQIIMRQVLSLFVVFLAGCATEIPSGSLLLRQVTEVYSREGFAQLDEGRRYKCFVLLGGTASEISDGSFVNTSGFKGPHNQSIDIAYVKPGLRAEVGDIVEMETYAIIEKNVITKIRQKKDEFGPCRYVVNRFLWNTAEDLYCDGIEREGWIKLPGSYGTFYKPPEGWTAQKKSPPREK